LENTDREMMKKLDKIIDAIAEMKLELKDKMDRH
jgi:hypothetical protein